MKCAKDTAVSLAVLLTVVSITSGLMFDQISQVRAESDKRTELVYSIPAIHEDLKEIKADIKDIKKYLLEHQK